MNCRRRHEATLTGRVQADNAKAKGTLYQGVAETSGTKPPDANVVPVTPETQGRVLRYHGDD